MNLYHLTDDRIGQSRLLDDDPGRRHEAFGAAVAHQRIDPGFHSSVWAVIVDPSAGADRARALASRIAASSRAEAVFVRERSGCLYFVTRARPETTTFDERIRELASRFELRVLGIGAALIEHSDYDLAPVAERAHRAASILAALPELGHMGWHNQLGPWIMLSRITPGSVRVRDISPAADVLLEPANSIYRQTVEVYLDVAGRIADACARLHIHRTTLYYRLDKAPEAVRDALHDGSARSSLHLALKLERLWHAHRESPIDFAL
jgi:sugar diacid utilization regulator